ncbi:MAG: pyridoxamine 5'-phosphate oxidase family protein [Methanomicrobiaceae archaeon]|nr:pyridoxamine 5'-phosphate oxidase family protein [Methanomicrobiaceae archaeon]
MSFADVVDFANRNPVCAFATADGDQPRVRYFLMWYADKDGFYFHTATLKQVYGQLLTNPKVELAFYDFNPPEQGGGTMLRVTGEVEFLEDAHLRNCLLEQRPFLKELGDDPAEYLAVMRVGRGEAWFWTMADNLHEDAIPRHKFP